MVAECILEYLVESLIVQTQSNKSQQKCTVAQEVVHSDYNTMDYLCKVANLSFLVPGHSENVINDFHHLTCGGARQTQLNITYTSMYGW